MGTWNFFSRKYGDRRNRFATEEKSTGDKRLLGSLLQDNLLHLQSTVGNSPDLKIRSLAADTGDTTRMAVIYIDNITDEKIINEFIIHPLSMLAESLDKPGNRNKSLPDIISSHMLSVGDVRTITDWDSIILDVLSGNTIIMIDGYAEAFTCETRGGETRAVDEPSTQVVIRGPKDGFTESIGTNVALVRRRIRSAHLRLEQIRIGNQTQTDIAFMYLKGIANDDIVDEVRSRLNKINTDAILESGYIEQLIQDSTTSTFPTLYNTERPDVVAGQILEGRVAVFVDGTPFALIAPATFFMFFQSPEDYYQQYQAATAIRLLRYVAFFFSLFGPSIYIAAITFHQDMIPTPLLISLMAQRESVPFPAFVEALLMEFTFEILREAGIRMPRAIGQAVSIVGALVLGQAAVEAGIVSSAMVIVVALTGISSISTPAFNMALSLRLLRFALMIFAAFMGFYGITLFSIFLLAHLCGLRSFGIPYMSPVAPFIPQDHKDTFIRLPIQAFQTRPRLISRRNVQRHPTGEGEQDE